jgi:preprotein translocase subunit SecY
MKNFIQTLKNIWSIDELKTRIMTTLGLILVFRIGSYVILPGVNPDELGGGDNAVAGLLDIFAGGALSRASIFALGIMPYITASIIMQLLGIAVPTIQKLQREGESGRRKINQWTRLLTIVICAAQAPGIIALTIPSTAHANTTSWWLTSIVILVAGSMFIMWLGEKITDKGIGNGISILIMIGIVANLPAAFVQELVTRHNHGAVVIILIEMAMLLFVILFSILLVQGTRRVPIQFAKRIVSGRGGRQQLSQGARQFLPIKVNAAGVMPIIFAQALMVLPTYIGQALQWDSLAGFADPRSFMYNAFLAVMIILFTYFYTAITINPNQMADELKRNGGFIPGVKPGKNTADFIDSLLSRITLPGSIFLALIAILPAFAMMFGIQQSFALFYGGTSLLIMVGVVLDTLQQIESYLLNRQYDGLMKSGRIKGRSSMPGVSV